MGNHAHRKTPLSGRNIRKHELTVAAWNVRTVFDLPDSTHSPARQSAPIAQELSRYGVDIAALSETSLADEGSLTESEGGYTFF